MLYIVAPVVDVPFLAAAAIAYEIQSTSTSVFQAHLMGIRRLVVLAHEWEAYYKDEFRRAARLARELTMAIEPMFEDEDPRFTKNVYDRNIDPELFRNSNPFETDEYDPTDAATTHDEDTTTV